MVRKSRMTQLLSCSLSLWLVENIMTLYRALLDATRMLLFTSPRASAGHSSKRLNQAGVWSKVFLFPNFGVLLYAQAHLLQTSQLTTHSWIALHEIFSESEEESTGTAKQPHERGMGRERRKTPALPAASQLIFKHFIQSWDFPKQSALEKLSSVLIWSLPSSPSRFYRAQLRSPPLAQQWVAPLQIILILIRLW